MPEPGNPQAFNRYAYVYNNPLRYTDPSGRWLETVWDVANILWDVHELWRDPGNLWNWAALVVDVGTTLLPGVPAFAGAVQKGGKVVKAAIEAAAHTDEGADIARGMEKALLHTDEAASALPALKQTTETAARKPPIVIGENMARVTTYAEQIGAETIKDWLAGRPWTPELNDEFIQAMMAEGREIIDIGPDFKRRLTHRLKPLDPEGRPPSKIYSRERQLLRGYPKHHRVYQRFGKYWGGVPGLDD